MPIRQCWKQPPCAHLDMIFRRIGCVFFTYPREPPLDFPTGYFDLATCVSILAFITTEEARRQFVAEIIRVVSHGGHIFLATPSPFRLLELHSRRLLGDWRKRPGYSWSSAPWSIHAMFAGCDLIPLASYRPRRHRILTKVAWAAPLLSWAFPWQQFLFSQALISLASPGQLPISKILCGHWRR